MLYYCSDAASYVTGQVFWEDGGLFLRSGNSGDRNLSPDDELAQRADG